MEIWSHTPLIHFLLKGCSSSVLSPICCVLGYFKDAVSYHIIVVLLCFGVALHENACREEAQVCQVQQLLQHRVGPEETR